jgi:hypothetical protein
MLRILSHPAMDDANQLDGFTVQIERPKHDFIGVIAAGRNNLAVENALDADFQLLFARKAV